MLEVVEAEYLGGYRIWVRFNNGESGEVNLENDADFAPEFLLKKVNIQ